MSTLEESVHPRGELTLQLPASRHDTNMFGDVYSGWLASQMVMAAETRAAKLAQGRIATVSIGLTEFMCPVLTGTLLSIYTELLESGHSSMRIRVEVWGQYPDDSEPLKVTENEQVLVAIDNEGHIRPLPKG